MESEQAVKLAQDLKLHFPESARLAVRMAMHTAYRDAGRMWDLTAGCDMQWFGFTVWKFAVHQIRSVIERDPNLGIRVVPSGVGAFRVALGPMVMSPYGCGYSVPSDPWTQFPNNDKGAGLLSDVNMYQLDIFPDIPGSPTALVLAHYGNPERGLEALYVKMPTESSNGRITRSGYVEEIAAIGERTYDVEPSFKETKFPAAAKIERPVTLPFRKPVTQEGSDSA